MKSSRQKPVRRAAEIAYEADLMPYPQSINSADLEASKRRRSSTKPTPNPENSAATLVMALLFRSQLRRWRCGPRAGCRLRHRLFTQARR